MSKPFRTVLVLGGRGMLGTDLTAALKQLRSAGIRLVDCVATEPRIRRRFLLRGFLPILGRAAFMLYSKAGLPDAAFCKVENWHLTLGCSDLEL